MKADLTLLVINAAAIGSIHTLLGPDHYLPFIVLSRTRRWSRPKTAWITLACGLGHVASSIIIGLIGFALGASLKHFDLIEKIRGEIATWVLLAFGLVYAGWAAASQPWHALVLFLVYGIYAAATEGVGKAFVTDLAPKTRRSTALGWFNGMTGFVALPANLLAGWLWSVYGPGATFALGAWAGLLSAALLIVWAPWLLRSRPLLGAASGAPTG